MHEMYTRYGDFLSVKGLYTFLIKIVYIERPHFIIWFQQPKQTWMPIIEQLTNLEEGEKARLMLGVKVGFNTSCKVLFTDLTSLTGLEEKEQ